MKKSNLLLVIILFLFSCSSAENERPVEWYGRWNAKWETLPESYPGVTDATFTMNGIFEFNRDQMTIVANGYPGCIFNADTITHSQTWKVSNDTLLLYNDPEVMSMTYKIKQINEKQIKLQLMEDIFITLSK